MDRIRAFYNKKDFDYSSGYIDPYDFHVTFYYMLKNYHVLDNETAPMWTYILKIVMWIFGLIGLVITALGVNYGVKILDIPYTTEAGSYFIVLSYKILILTCAKLNKPYYNELVKIMRQDFLYVCTCGVRYRDRFFQNQVYTWKICIITIIFIVWIGVGMITVAILLLCWYLGTHEQGDGKERPLMFPFWFNEVNFYKSPVYEIAYVYSILVVLCYVYNYIFMIQTNIVWVREIAVKADLMIWSIQDLLEEVHPATNEEEGEQYTRILLQRLREIIIQHHSLCRLLETYAVVYKKLLMFEQKFCGPVVCFTTYSCCVKFEDGELNFILVLLCIAAFVVYFVPSYLCTFLDIKVKSVSDACWNMEFWNAQPCIRPFIVLIMQRSIRRLPLQAPGFDEITIETFAAKMASAYSMFNMLRRLNI